MGASSPSHSQRCELPIPAGLPASLPRGEREASLLPPLQALEPVCCQLHRSLTLSCIFSLVRCTRLLPPCSGLPTNILKIKIVNMLTFSYFLLLPHILNQLPFSGVRSFFIFSLLNLHFPLGLPLSSLLF